MCRKWHKHFVSKDDPLLTPPKMCPWLKMIILKGTWKELRRIGSNVRLVRAYSDFPVYPHGKALVGNSSEGPQSWLWACGCARPLRWRSVCESSAPAGLVLVCNLCLGQRAAWMPVCHRGTTNWVFLLLLLIINIIIIIIIIIRHSSGIGSSSSGSIGS